jgi:LuxR family maltose regulon positive regulatory protein
LSDAESTHNTRRLIEILPLLALVEEAQGQTTAALAALERAVNLAQPGGFIRTFVDSGPTIARLLYQLADRSTAPDYIGRILAAFPNTPTPGEPGQTIKQTTRAKLVEPLSERELEVLTLLNNRLADKEIAQLLSISPLTVRKHNQNIYRKLDVTSRKQAIARARALGLLQPG